MNLMGKILVFLTLVFSVIVMVVAVMVYATHKNWRDAVESTSPGRPGYKMIVDNLKKENERLVAEKAALHDQLVAQRLSNDISVATAETTNARLQSTVQALEKNKVEADQKLATSAATLQTQQQSLQSHQEAETKAREALLTLITENDERKIKFLDLISEYHARLAEIPALKEREQQLTADFARASELLHMMGRTSQDSLTTIPPPVDGTIVAMGRRDDPNLIELSMGKDDGLRLNHRVDLYRGKDYLGYAVITELDTSGNRVAAKVMDKKAPIRVGDNFTTRLQSLTMIKKGPQ